MLEQILDCAPSLSLSFGLVNFTISLIFSDVYFDTIEFDADRILEVAAKAQEFKLFRLGCICENLISQNLSVDNVLVLLMSSEEQHSQSVKVTFFFFCFVQLITLLTIQ